MNFLQRLLAPVFSRLYQTASGHKAVSDWIVSNADPAIDIARELPALRRQSRDIVHNNDYGRNGLRALLNNVVGDQGFTVKIDDSESQDVTDQITQHWYEFSCPENFSFNKLLSRAQVERMAFESLLRDGDCFLRIVRGNNYKYKLALQIIPSSSVVENKNQILPNGNIVSGGVEITRDGTPVAVWLYNLTQSDLLYGQASGGSETRVPFVDPKTGMVDIIHFCIRNYPIQFRGAPHFSSSILRLKLIDDIEKATGHNVKAGAMKVAAFIRQPSNVGIPAPVGTKTEDINIAPGAFIEVPSGYDLKPIDWSNLPGDQLNQQLIHLLRGVAAGIGVPYSVLTKDLSQANYSSIRAGAVDAQDQYRVFQDEMITQVCVPIFNQWLALSEIQGITPGKSDITYTINGRRWQWTDPLADARAKQLEIQMGLTSRRQIISQMPGDVEFESVIDDLEKESSAAKIAGVNIDGDLGAKVAIAENKNIAANTIDNNAG